MIEVIAQWGAAICGCTAMACISTKGRLHRWGYIIGLLGQPFWFITTLNHKQWGIFILSAIYTLSYINGIRNWFGKCVVSPDVCDKAPEPTGDPDEDYWYHRQ